MAGTKKKILETDLYPPLKKRLEENGYTVRAEVGNCDVAAVKDGGLVVIEMKRAVNLDLLLQVVKRQEASDSVYAAVPAPAVVDRRWREIVRLLKRLEAGLILIYLDSAVPRAEVAFHPVLQERRRRPAAGRALLTEMSGRSLDLNTGGCNRRKIMTAYREQAVHVAALLSRFDSASPKTLKTIGAPGKAGTILLDNHYGWFDRVGRGAYALTEAGRQALSEYRELAEKLVG